MSVSPVGVSPLGGLLDVAVAPRTSAVAERSGSVGIAWLLELSPLYRATGYATTQVVGLCGLDPIGVAGLGQTYDLQRIVAVEAPTRRYVSLGDGMMTRATDSPADTFIEGRLSAPSIRIRRQLPDTGDRLQGFVAQTGVTIELDGTDGGLDGLLTDEVMRDRPVTLKKALTTRLARGTESPPALADFAPAFSGRCTNLEIDASDKVQVTVADDFSRLDRPIQQRTYAGTGGIEGSTEVTGLPLPLAYGICPGHEPTLVDPLRLIYQVHDGQVLRIRVHDRGETITNVRDVETYEQLVALVSAGEVVDDEDAEYDIGFGQVATCRKLGYFRLGSSPVGPVTCDVEGDGLYDGPVGYRGNRLYVGGRGYRIPGSQTHNKFAGGIVYRVLTTRGGFRPAEIDIDRIAQFDNEHPWLMGISIPSSQRPTIREVCTRVADSVGAVILRNRLGQLFMRALRGPGTSSQIKIGPADVSQDGVERLALPWGAPWHTVQLTYAPRFRPLTSDEASAALSAETSALFQRAFATVTRGDAALLALLPDRPPLEIDTLLVEEADAKLAARQVLDFYRGIWALYRVVLRGIGFRADVLSTVVLTYPRHGLTNGRPLLVLAVEEEPGVNSTTLLLAG